MLNQTQVDAFKQNGFVKGNRILDGTQIQELQKELDRVISIKKNSNEPRPVRLSNLSKDEGSVVWQIVDIWKASEPYKRLMFNEQITEEIAQLTEAAEIRIWHDQIQYKIATKGGVNMWHQDSPYWPNIQPKDAQVTAWVALDDIDAANGCMSMVPGSHLWGDQISFLHTLDNYDSMPAAFENHQLETKLCPVPKGTVHYHHSLTWHGSHANTSDRPRRAVAMHYMTEKTRYDASGNHIMKEYIDVADGAFLTGEYFPLVWQRR